MSRNHKLLTVLAALAVSLLLASCASKQPPVTYTRAGRTMRRILKAIPKMRLKLVCLGTLGLFLAGCHASSQVTEPLRF